VGQVQGSAGTTVTYQTPAGTYYHVTYAPNGSYQYVANSSSTPSVLGAYSSSPSQSGSAPSVQGSYAPSAGGIGISSMPRTGGGSAPEAPFLPVLAGLAMIGLGAFTRKFALARR
jgi:hypothetical protein